MTLYLKYRPTDFESLVWQDFIKNTLRQAIVKDKLVWAYLFCWPRWTGKTSTARVFAKSINCTNKIDWNPCLSCDICKWFIDNSLVDIIEIDAASYTWVDNIRDIIEKAQFSPTKCKYKVYIIDEVHMLSKWAFNALLKILEEPPEHLKFILATTESHKIPETILSRCQRYDFKSIIREDLVNRLKYIASKENIKIDNESLEFIVKQSNWGLRNAISLFEQLIYNDEIKYENIVLNYSIPKVETLKKFYNKLYNKDESLVMELDNVVWEYNLNLFLKELLFFVRDMLILDISDNNKTLINIKILDIIEETIIKLKNSIDSKVTLLVWVVKIIRRDEFFLSIEKTKNNNENINTKVTKKIIEKNIDVSFENETEQNELSADDLFDVFWDNDVIIENIPLPPPKQEKKQDIIKPEINTSFDIEKFISFLKTLWAKWALTMSLRASNINFDSKTLYIYTKTSIALKQISTWENLLLLNQSLEKMWYENILIEIK